MPETRLLGVDWGASNLRVLRIGASGELLGVRAESGSAGAAGGEAFHSVLRRLAGDWLSAEVGVLICGMAGPVRGWRDAAYCSCPAGLEELARAVTPVAGLDDAWLVSGVATRRETALEDVMRGEETQVMGLSDPEWTGTVVAPGTHSKWIQMERGRIVALRTFMTGELFAAVMRSTIIGVGLSGPHGDLEAFQAGLARSFADPALAAAIFSTRVRTLSEGADAASPADYLSGVLIGNEVVMNDVSTLTGPLMLVGEPKLTRLYGLAIRSAGGPDVMVEDGTAMVARGLWRIWERMRA